MRAVLPRLFIYGSLILIEKFKTTAICWLNEGHLSLKNTPTSGLSLIWFNCCLCIQKNKHIDLILKQVLQIFQMPVEERVKIT